MQSVSSQMFSEKSLADNNTYGVVKRGNAENVNIENGEISVSIDNATSNKSGLVMPGDGYYIDDDGRLQEKPFQAIKKICVGFSITTEEPSEGWYNGETYIEQNLWEEGFVPTANTWYKNANYDGRDNFYLRKNCLYYWNGSYYITYYTNSGTDDFPDYNPITSLNAWTWESGKYYSRDNTITPLFEEPSDWSTNWKNYYSNDYSSSYWYCFTLLSNSSAPTFKINKFYSGNNLVYNLSNIEVNCRNLTINVFSRCHLNNTVADNATTRFNVYKENNFVYNNEFVKVVNSKKFWNMASLCYWYGRETPLFYTTNGDGVQRLLSDVSSNGSYDSNANYYSHASEHNMEISASWVIGSNWCTSFSLTNIPCFADIRIYGNPK